MLLTSVFALPTGGSSAEVAFGIIGSIISTIGVIGGINHLATIKKERDEKDGLKYRIMQLEANEKARTKYGTV